MLDKTRVSNAIAKLQKNAKFDEAIDCIMVLSRSENKLKVGSKFFKDNNTIKYIIEGVLPGYQTISIKTLKEGNYMGQKCEFYTTAEAFARIMKECGLTLYKMKHKLKVISPRGDSTNILKVNKNSLIFKICNMSQIQTAQGLLFNAYADISQINPNIISKIYIKTTMGKPIRII